MDFDSCLAEMNWGWASVLIRSYTRTSSYGSQTSTSYCRATIIMTSTPSLRRIHKRCIASNDLTNAIMDLKLPEASQQDCLAKIVHGFIRDQRMCKDLGDGLCLLPWLPRWDSEMRFIWPSSPTYLSNAQPAIRMLGMLVRTIAANTDIRTL